MSMDRRRFLQLGLLAAAYPVGCSPSGADRSANPPGGTTATEPEPTPDAGPTTKSLLVLGGTRFLGPAVVDEALAAGLEVTLFNRGKSDPKAYPELEKLIGDRDPDKGAGLSALEGRKWDAVIDTSGYFPRHVKASAELLAPNVRQYLFISSVSAYAGHDKPGSDEDSPLAQLEDPTVETMGDQFQHYGGLKVLCEQAAERAMPGRVANVRPGYIVGPRDPTDRFTYWPWRVAQGGDVVVPGSADDPIQVIDVRDLGRWLVQMAINDTRGVFNAVGPKTPTTMGAVMEACQAATGSDARLHWASLEFLEAQGEPLPFPIWAPPAGESAGFHQYSNARATEAGLSHRPLSEVVADLWTWFSAQPEERRKTPRAGLPPAVEQQLIAALTKG
ncbi:MAG: NAD-dependent epimerase/dehydratase family protein [Deltaproteobacteria bacterium]|nr:NAD-dependent epimerase/dehydratase family protein [Deltaproteobacteria bacterium]